MPPILSRGFTNSTARVGRNRWKGNFPNPIAEGAHPPNTYPYLLRTSVGGGSNRLQLSKALLKKVFFLDASHAGNGAKAADTVAAAAAATATADDGGRCHR